jgi:hypothetical protein
MEDLGRVPPKGRLINLQTNEEQVFQFNPTRFVETIAPRYTRISPPGLGHDRLAYENTSSNSIPLDLFMDQLGQDLESGTGGSRPFIPLTRKKFLQALLYPVTRSTPPPQLLFIWPRMISIVGRIVGPAQFQHQEFASTTGATTRLVVKINIEEDREIGLLMEEVRRQGSYSPNEGLTQGGTT